MVAFRLGHADSAVTLRVYSHVLREHTVGIGDIFAQAVKAQLANPLACQVGKADHVSICPGQSGEVFTFGAELGKWGGGWRLPTG